MISKAKSLIETLDEKPQLITSGVYGAAYLPSREGTHLYLTHAVLVQPDQDWPLPLCRKVKNVMDDSTQWTHEEPTCPVCSARWRKLKAKQPELMDWEEYKG